MDPSYNQISGSTSATDPGYNEIAEFSSAANPGYYKISESGCASDSDKSSTYFAKVTRNSFAKTFSLKYSNPVPTRIRFLKTFKSPDSIKTSG